MKKYRIFSLFVLCLFAVQFFAFTAFANSSWFWISETRPYDVLPWVALGTLIIETVSLIAFAKIRNGYKVFSFVAIANAISFAMPYLSKYILSNEEMFPYEKYLENWPSYTVGFSFCLTTIIIELPVVYFALKKNSVSHKKLAITVVISNIVTTVLVAVVERIFCVGSW